MPLPDIDLVYTFVDGADPVHAAKLAATRRKLCAGGGTAIPEVRPTWYRHVSEITYSVRSAIKYLPWLRTIFIVTDRQIPPVDAALIASGKVRIIDHSEIIPEHCLPVFDATIIESFLHRIPGLSGFFLYNNDDMLFGGPMGPEEFIASSGGDIRLRLMTQPGILRAGIALASKLTPSFMPRANTFTSGIANACRILRQRPGLAWSEIVYPRHFTHVYRTATARRIEEELGDILEEARGQHLRSHRQIAWIALAYSLEAHWHGAERCARPRADRLFLDFERHRSAGETARAWRRLERSKARFLCFNNIPVGQADRLEQIMRRRGLGDPLASGT